MAYQKHNFKKDELLKASELNEMEDQIAANEGKADEAKTMADSAASAAGAASSAANSASAVANEAMNKAQQALNASGGNEEALNVAQRAETKAEQAVDNARTAAQVSAEAHSIATNASANANNALNKVNQIDQQTKETLTNRGLLTSDHNLDDVKQQGMYQWYSEDAPRNVPVSNYDGMLIVFSSGFETMQIASIGVLGVTYIRAFYPNKWEQWSELSSPADTAMKYRGKIESDGDFNNVTVPGVYKYDNAFDDVPANAPFAKLEGSNPVVLVFGDDGIESTSGNMAQIAIGKIGQEPIMRIRFCVSDTSWTHWVTISDNVSGRFDFVKTLTTEDDLNAIIANGIYDYYTEQLPVNAPFDDRVADILVYASGPDGTSMGMVTQIATARFGENTHVKIRNGNRLGYWSEWMEIPDDKSTICYRNTLGNGADLNTVLKNGVYGLHSGCINEPIENDTNGIMIVFGGDGYPATDMVAQLYIEGKAFGSSVKPKALYRIGTDSGSLWTGWTNIYNGSDVEVVQTTGGSTTAVMSQDAVTKELEKLADNRSDVEIVQETGGSTTAVMSQDAVTKELKKMADDGSLEAVLQTIFTNGVFITDNENALLAEASDGMKVVIQPGVVMVNGHAKSKARSTRTFLTPNSDRIEVYYYRLNISTGEFEVGWKTVVMYGDAMLSISDNYLDLPLRANGVYDILICRVTVPANATEITAEMVEDLRANENYCGFVKSKIGPTKTKVLNFVHENGQTETVEVYVK